MDWRQSSMNRGIEVTTLREILIEWFHKLTAWVTSLQRETILLLGLVLVALIAQGVNMFHAPYITRMNDEGIYIEQAWSVLRQGLLAPYTYTYDHAPAAWILVAGWMGLVGGPHAFGSAIDTGRVFMLLLHAGSVPLLFYLARKLGVSTPMAGFAAFLFSISPLSIYFQRAVLLDNIMVFWLLVSLNFIIDGEGRLSRFMLSGVTFGIAVLSKETAIVMLPVMLYIVYRQRKEYQSYFSFPSWLIPMFFVASWYPLYALIKGELIPVSLSVSFSLLPQVISIHLTDIGSKVTLIQALIWQSSRSGGSILNPNGLFWQLVWTNWFPKDPFLIVAGTIAVLANLVRGFRNREALVIGLLGALPMLFLARGGIIYDFYIAFVIPFMILNIAAMIDGAAQVLLHRPVPGFWAASMAAVLLGAYVFTGLMRPLYQSTADIPDREALAWIDRNISPNSKIIIPDSFWVDLHEPASGTAPYNYAHSYWKAAFDPAIQNGVFHNDWRQVNYVIFDQQMQNDFQGMSNTIAVQALKHAQLVQSWNDGGNFVQVWKVNPGAP